MLLEGVGLLRIGDLVQSYCTVSPVYEMVSDSAVPCYSFLLLYKLRHEPRVNAVVLGLCVSGNGLMAGVPCNLRAPVARLSDCNHPRYPGSPRGAFWR